MTNSDLDDLVKKQSKFIKVLPGETYSNLTYHSYTQLVGKFGATTQYAFTTAEGDEKIFDCRAQNFAVAMAAAQVKKGDKITITRSTKNAEGKTAYTVTKL